jgi:hypothetical protein
MLAGAPLVSDALACSCAPPSRADQARSVAAIFVGEVTGTPEPPRDRSSPAAGRLRYRFRVAEMLKGKAAETVEVTTPASPAACGTSFTAGQRYLVFAHDREGTLETGLCDFDVSGAEIDSVTTEIRRVLRGP